MKTNEPPLDGDRGNSLATDRESRARSDAIVRADAMARPDAIVYTLFTAGFIWLSYIELYAIFAGILGMALPSFFAKGFSLAMCGGLSSALFYRAINGVSWFKQFNKNKERATPGFNEYVFGCVHFVLISTIVIFGFWLVFIPASLGISFWLALIGALVGMPILVLLAMLIGKHLANLMKVDFLRNDEKD